jgi:hypothetical protein
VDEQSLEIVKRMWIDYREQGVETALAHCHQEVEFQPDDGRVWVGHDGIRAFFSRFTEEQGRHFAASPYTFEPSGEGVIVAGHRRIRSGDSSDSDYTYFSHHVHDGLITRVAAWNTREEATRDVEPRS